MTDEEQELDLSRQSKLVPIEEVNRWTIHVFGVGSIGSHVVNVLAKTGFRNIHVYDMDEVDEENVAPQAFRFKDIGKNKVAAMADIVKENSGVDIVTHHGRIDEDTVITPEPETIYACFFDSFEARKMLWNKLKDFPVVFADARIGRYDMRYYLIDCMDKENIEIYEETLPEDDGEGSELVCGEKASAPINTQLAGMIVMNMVMFIADKDYIRGMIGNASTPNMNIFQPVLLDK